MILILTAMVYSPVPHHVQAAYRVSGMEIGGLLGTFSSGVFSDKVKGSRIPVMLVYLAGEPYAS